MQAGLIGILAGAITWMGSAGVLAQAVGDEAELERLQSRAEEAIANGDTEGAAMSSGKAALMAAQLAKRQPNPAASVLFQGTEALFRGQEQAYRALALFQRAGGQPPASSGVCRTIQLAKQHLDHSVRLLSGQAPATTDLNLAQRVARLQAATTDWVKTVEGMIADFQCG
ncbi:MAG TPA: hypothetical protein VJM82_04970 [Nitrospiraceae bacterium]|nr:hypothetical protein [Nitrospiraceae bacterium]